MSPMKICSVCGGTYPNDVFFTLLRKITGDICNTERRPICRGCEQTARDAVKEKNRWPGKIRSTIQRHARRFKKTAQELQEDYGWAPEQMIRDAQRAFQGSCVYCDTEFAVMPNGFWDLTLDIVDPRREPYYRTNVRWCCATCNRAKHQTSPELWAALLTCWEKWRQRRGIRKPEPKLVKLPFDDTE